MFGRGRGQQTLAVSVLLAGSSFHNDYAPVPLAGDATALARRTKK